MGLFDFLKNLSGNKVTNTGKIPDDLVIPKPHVMNIKVAGVTQDGRQEIIKKIEEKQPPFNKVLNVEFVGVPFEGELAIEVRINKQHIGYVPKKRISEFIKHKDFGYEIERVFASHFIDEETKRTVYYFTIRVVFDK